MKRLLIVLIMCVVLLTVSAGCVGTPGVVTQVYTEDGVTVYQNADGSHYGIDEEGNEVWVNPDGSYSGKTVDGSTVTGSKNGDINYQGTDGTSVVGNNQSGTAVTEDGSTMTWTTDASGVIHYTIVDKETGETYTYSSTDIPRGYY
ncbi:hypothetical protein [Methanorbis rubei]|uniref:Uncharacterized protein n=1 Tax=Methanorbis rubei TaxID=3028300 RepID=A0AAE4MFW5_9EURY|nr:hypothetical protein [Methanocorpusculaceae archaeon Cs1]